MNDELAADGTPKLKPSMKARRRKFAREYAVDFNGSRAAREAGYSVNSARVQAHRLLKRSDVRSGIEAVLVELKAIAFSDITQLLETRQLREQIGLDNEGEPLYRQIDRTVLRDITALPANTTACIHSIRTRSQAGVAVTELKLYDKQNALEKLMRYYGGYTTAYTPQSDPEDSLLAMIFPEGSETCTAQV